jgi:class 3 adenylate cyclase
MEKVLAVRYTWVFVLEAGAWKIAQTHVSIPKPNLEVIGVEHVAFEELIESAKSTYSHEGSEGTATVMFTDIVNSTSIASAVGDRAWASTISWHLESVTSIIEENGGSVVKTLGDGTMSTFLSARGAMSAARAIQFLVTNSQREPQFQIRIGLHTGDVIQSEGDFFGSVVNKAARIASAAVPSQILVSDATRVMVGNSPDFNFADSVAVILKGIEGEQSISTLEWS